MERLTRGTASYLNLSIFLTERASLSATGRALRKLRFRFADLCSRLWLRIACRRSSFPLPVSLNRFFAPLRVFVLGISFDSRVLRRREHHHHVATVEERRRFDRADLLDV